MNALTDALLSEDEGASGRLALPGFKRDPNDDPVAACAKEARADHIVADDKDLLALGGIRKHPAPLSRHPGAT